MRVRHIPLEDNLKNLNFNEGEKAPIIKKIQNRLKELNLYLSEIHGIYDTETKDAVTAFQELQKLPTTGTLDPITFCRLTEAKSLMIETHRGKLRAKLTLPRANILIAKSSRQLTVFSGNTPLRTFPVAIGKPSTPTPVGNFAIAFKLFNPGGVLGSRWMGLNYDAYGIHGTNAPWLIGKMVSNGCIRMHNSNAEELYALINVGTPVFIRD